MLINKILNKIKRKLESSNTLANKLKLPESAIVYGSSLSIDVHVQKGSQVLNSKLNGKILLSENSKIVDSEINGKINLGYKSNIHKCTLNGNIEIGQFTTLWGPNLDIFTHRLNVKIGNFCSIARNVSIQAYNHNAGKITSYFIGKNLFNESWENEIVSKGNILIENDIWIGSHCVILGGVKVSNGAVIAANSVVNNDVPPYAIVAGSPAKVIGYRFSPEEIEKLLRLEWWNWDENKIKQHKKLFESDRIDINEIDLLLSIN